MNNHSSIKFAGLKIKNRFLSDFSGKNRLLVLTFGIVGFVLPMLYGYINGFPVPHIHDEFSYLLAADTYAHGRLTNPTPPSWENFEAPHILVTPNYMSKYPPMQGLFLAAGQVLFGHPAFGVWLSCGVAAAAFLWMMLAWTERRWAIVGTLLMILFIGINSYWAQSYWGGMVAAAGGALFLGGFRRLFKELNAIVVLQMTFGGVILVNSRPFEGTVMMLPAFFVLLLHLLRDKNNTFSRKFSQVILPGALLTAATLSAMAYYNYRLTGDALRFAYTEHQSQYFSTPLFTFQSPTESNLQGHPRLQKLYESLNCSDPIRNLDYYGLPHLKSLYPVYGLIYLLVFFPFFLLSPPLLIFFYISTFILIFRDKWLMLVAGTIFFTFCCMSMATYWDNFHYEAPLTCCFFLLIAEGFRKFVENGKKASKENLVLILLLLLSATSLVYQVTYVSSEWFFPVKSVARDKNFSNLKINLNDSLKLQIPEKTTYLKPIIERAAQESSENYLAIVSYNDKYTFLEDIIYNEANIENSKLIWAYDLGEQKNEVLLNYFKDRKVLRITISGSQLEIKPYQ